MTTSKHGSPRPYKLCGHTLYAATLLAALAVTGPVRAQDGSAEKGITKGGFLIHQSVDLGGHLSYISGSGPMYDTLVNLHSGLRVLNHSLTMHATGKPAFHLFDDLSTASAGYGGDPNNFTTLSMSKGKLYDLNGTFRRDRQYFDYNLLDNPLVPAGVTSNGYTFPQVLDTPHLFNTVRRMTDVGLTLLPLSRVHLRLGYSQNVMQGPSYSSVHFGPEALLYQAWRNSTDTWLAGADVKPFSKTTLTYEEQITHYKGDTSWGLAGLNLRLSNGTPAAIGFDNVSAPSCTGGPAISSSTTSPPTLNANCNGYLQYTRNQPTRSLFPTEIFRFQSSDVPRLQLNGGIRYTGASMNLPSYYEYFNGLVRSASFSASLAPNQHYSLDLSYGYIDVFSRTGICFTATPAPAGAVAVPTGTKCGTNVYLGTGYYDAPSQSGSLGLAWAPVKRLRTALGYRANGLYGASEFLNPRNVAGALQSQFHTSYASLDWTVAPGWAWKADWNYSGYGEATAIGPTLPRSFHSNLLTLAVHHQF